MNEVPIKVQKLDPNAKVPTYATDGSAGFDLYSCEDIFLHKGNIHAVSTGIAVEIPVGYEMQVRPRSGLSLKGVILVNSPGTIDSDYRGEIRILLLNLSCRDEKFIIRYGDRIAQGFIFPILKASFTEAKSLSNTERGPGGFGSTGR